MKKFIIAVIVIVILIVVIAGKIDVQRKEDNLRALERAALQAELNDGAPLAWMCRAFSMTLAVNDDGEPMCSGKAMWNGDEVVAENIAAFHLMGSCTAANGVAKLGGTVQAGAPQLVVRCTATRFGERWQASK